MGRKGFCVFLYGLGGFIGGLIFGAIVNAMLLKDVPPLEWRKNRDLKLKYGALNWAFAIAGAVIAVSLAKLL